VLDEVKKKIQRAGGHALFPYNVVRIQIRAAADEGAVFERDFFRRFFDEELRKGLSKEACRFPEDLRVEIPSDERRRKWLRVETLAEDIALPSEEAPRAKKTAKLVVAAGPPIKRRSLCRKRASISDAWATFIKRRGSRAATISRLPRTIRSIEQVSREHAHIVHDKKTGEYRLFNDRWYKRGNKAENQLRTMDRARRDGPRSASRYARNPAAAGRRNSPGKAVIKFQIK